MFISDRVSAFYFVMQQARVQFTWNVAESRKVRERRRRLPPFEQLLLATFSFLFFFSLFLILFFKSFLPSPLRSIFRPGVSALELLCCVEDENISSAGPTADLQISRRVGILAANNFIPRSFRGMREPKRSLPVAIRCRYCEIYERVHAHALLVYPLNSRETRADSMIYREVITTVILSMLSTNGRLYILTTDNAKHFAAVA